MLFGQKKRLNIWEFDVIALVEANDPFFDDNIEDYEPQFWRKWHHIRLGLVYKTPDIFLRRKWGEVESPRNSDANTTFSSTLLLLFTRYSAYTCTTTKPGL
jgi:hypothetical protein